MASDETAGAEGHRSADGRFASREMPDRASGPSAAMSPSVSSRRFHVSLPALWVCVATVSSGGAAGQRLVAVQSPVEAQLSDDELRKRCVRIASSTLR